MVSSLSYNLKKKSNDYFFFRKKLLHIAYEFL